MLITSLIRVDLQPRGSYIPSRLSPVSFCVKLRIINDASQVRVTAGSFITSPKWAGRYSRSNRASRKLRQERHVYSTRTAEHHPSSGRRAKPTKWSVTCDNEPGPECPLSSSGGEGRGEEAVFFRVPTTFIGSAKPTKRIRLKNPLFRSEEQPL